MKHVSVKLNQEDGSCTLCFEKQYMKNLHAQVRLSDGRMLKSTEMKEHKIEENTDCELGGCRKIRFVHENSDSLRLVQEFELLEENIAVSVSVESSEDVSSNHMVPVCADSGRIVIDKNGNAGFRMLAAPFDNDVWIRFEEGPVRYAQMSYGFTAIWKEGSREGIVLGALDHDTWKTGITADENEKGDVTALNVTCGVATEVTRDLDGLPHGAISGRRISSARIFIGAFDDYQLGFQVFGSYVAKVKPMLPWNGPVLFGWNSWAAYQGTIDFQKYKDTSDFLAAIKNSYADEEGYQYINYDAGWPAGDMKESVEYVKKNGQKAGAYMAPFLCGNNLDGEITGTDGKYVLGDIILRDYDGNVLSPIGRNYSVDPTHPGTLAKIRYDLDRFIEWGFSGVKIDFLAHASREGKFYREDIKTGMQAFHYAMQYIVDYLSEERIGRPFFISLSICPIFAQGYGHARRVSCDAFATIRSTEYMLQSMTYLWWMNNCLYRFNDPDHLVLWLPKGKHSVRIQEAYTRYNSGIICGSLMINSDDFYLPEARERAYAVMTDNEINDVVRKGESFRPVSGNYENFAADTFMREDTDGTLVCIFNYSVSDERKVVLGLENLGRDPKTAVKIKNLWTKEENVTDGVIRGALIPGESVLLKVFR